MPDFDPLLKNRVNCLQTSVKSKIIFPALLDLAIRLYYCASAILATVQG